MSTDLTSFLNEARTYLKRYVLATRSDSQEVKSFEDALVDILPQSLSLEASESPVPIFVAVSYCHYLVWQIHQAGARSPVSPKDAIGSMDVQAVDMLIEIIITVLFRPFLTDGLGTHLPKNPAMKGTGHDKICSRSEFNDILRSMVSCLSDTAIVTPVTVCLKKSLNLALLAAGVIESTYNPDCSPISPGTFDELIKSLAPQINLRTMQMLYTRGCPPWARRIIGQQMTKVLLGPEGLRHVSAFVLQPNQQGEIPSERFDHLSSLVASVPVDMSTKEYMLVLIPQIFDAFDDTSATGELRRRAMSYIVKRLFDVHADSSLLADQLWKPIVQGALPSEEPVTHSLQILSNMTSFSSLRAPMLNNRAVTMLVAGYTYHTAREHSNRDMIERLFYRYMEDDAQTDLCQSVEDFMRETQAMFPSDDSLAATRLDCSSFDYMCRVIDQIKGDGTSILILLRSLLRRYLASSEPILQMVRVRFLMALPGKYSSFVFSSLQTPIWITEITAILSGSIEEDQILVLFGILQCLIETRPEFNKGEDVALEKLIKSLSNIQKNITTQELVETAHAISQKLDLVLLTTRASSLQLRTEGNSQMLDSTEARKKYMAALKDMGDDMIPNRAHGLYLIGELATSDSQSIINLDQISPVMLGLLSEEEPFVHHNAMKVMKKLLKVYDTRYKAVLEAALKDDRYSGITRDRISLVLAEDA